MKKLATTFVVALVASLVAALFSATPASAAHVPSRVTAAVQAASPFTATAAKPRKLTKARIAKIRARAAVLSVPSKWRGIAMLHPAGRTFPTNVSRWANLVSVVMAEHKIPAGYLNGILAQIQQESYGDPTVVNLWDSNSRRGTPSMGLLQVIAPTYLLHARNGLREIKYQAQPYANIWAALKYAKSRYGMTKFATWKAGQNQGY